MDLKQLEYFACVAELGSFTRASIQLNIAQPALSRQVRQLEVELRRSLLTRNGRGAKVTEAGQLLLDHARGILYQIARAKEDLGSGSMGLAGHVAIGMPPTISRLTAVGLARQFGEHWPHASLEVVEGFSIQLRDALVQGQLDLALMYNAVASPDIEIKPLLFEPLMLVSPPSSQAIHSGKQTAARAFRLGKRGITLEAISRLQMVLPSRPNAFRLALDEALAKRGLKPDVAFEINGIGAILALVGEGFGHALLPLSAVIANRPAQMLNLKRIEHPGLIVQVALAFSARRPMTQTQRATMTWLSENIAGLLAIKSQG
jgi:LysR family transcriptional regulator, nitrogen assimilation regulatory protein